MTELLMVATSPSSWLRTYTRAPSLRTTAHLGDTPTGRIALSSLSTVLTTDTLLLPLFTTKSCLPSGVSARPQGIVPVTRISASITSLVELIASTVFRPELATYISAASVLCTKTGLEPVGRLTFVEAPMEILEPTAVVKTLTESDRLFATQTRVPCKAACTGIMATRVTPSLESPETSTCMPVPGFVAPFWLTVKMERKFFGSGGCTGLGMIVGR